MMREREKNKNKNRKKEEEEDEEEEEGGKLRGRERGQHLDYALENKENVEATYSRYFWVVICRELYISVLNISVLFKVFFGIFFFFTMTCVTLVIREKSRF